ncbi:hypothetical protein evm_010270 [Chilo suppressalis]|nr:hypothetical protein evm_010270 [Chilo suppressalis]
MTEIESPRSEVFPPFICPNVREKIVAEDVRFMELFKQDKITRKKSQEDASPRHISLEKPIPLYPLTITWSPNHLRFEIKDDPVVQKVWVWNTCYHTIYINCCNLWNDIAYLGARWHGYPETRFHLAPGLKGKLFIRAVPKEQTPLAAAHKRDLVTGFFSIPVTVKYLNFVEYAGVEG